MSMDLIYYLGIAAAVYMAWNIGANDVANAMGTSVGSRALTLVQAVIFASLFEFAGAVLVGAHVTQTIRKGIVDVSLFAGRPDVLAVGMFSALIAAGTWLLAATYMGLPVSTTHSIVGAVAGIGLFQYGFAGVHWGKIGTIILSWIISPVMGALMGFTMFTFIRKRILAREDPLAEIKKYSPFLLFGVFFIISMSVIFKGLKNLKLDLDFRTAAMYSAAVAAGLSIVSGVLVRLIRPGQNIDENLKKTEYLFGFLQVLTACYVAFAHGSNDVANAVGPIAAIQAIVTTGTVAKHVEVPLWILSIGGVGIVLGLSTWGYRVMFTIGKRITDLTPSRGFSAEISAATIILVCSKLGLPISTTHTIVGSVIGVGFARGIAALDLKVLRNIFVSWALEIPVTIILAGVLHHLIMGLFM